MPNPQAAQLIAKHLPNGLPHPGNPEQNEPPTTIQFPAFRTTGLPPQLAETVNKTSQQIGEAIIHLLETQGHYQITQATPTTDTIQDSEYTIIRCSQCHGQLFAVKPDGVHPELFLRHLKKIQHNCDKG